MPTTLLSVQTRILQYYGIDVTKDSNSLHPNQICFSCYTKLTCLHLKRKSALANLPRYKEIAIVVNNKWNQWFSGSGEFCQPCLTIQHIAKGCCMPNPDIDKKIYGDFPDPQPSTSCGLTNVLTLCECGTCSDCTHASPFPPSPSFQNMDQDDAPYLDPCDCGMFIYFIDMCKCVYTCI